ncbi:DNA gyrase inhibitor YacG [Marinomonas sp. 15G1-11]|uniref:DNA gyrase inhibitor YacG n=1 Tax=Marinomonas phaeophyticola TaxID=3004091 RepID=A0ABT4JQ31_9GAMM|nr:DNA gyrase inhibitor YacG [Marinomonas sp. 15G1-11]MCZ2720474.1 DNA gyrase inhibitor YacG [Marinomonas sp. 15G1-11]
MNKVKQNTFIACPTCKKQTLWSKENDFRPFCSDKCKLIDFGDWANESYSIPQIDSEEDEIMTADLSSDSGYLH